MLFILLGPQIWAIVSDNLSVDHFRPVVKGILNIFFGSLKNFLDPPSQPSTEGISRQNSALCTRGNGRRRGCARLLVQGIPLRNGGDGLAHRRHRGLPLPDDPGDAASQQLKVLRP